MTDHFFIYTLLYKLNNTRARVLKGSLGGARARARARARIIYIYIIYTRARAGGRAPVIINKKTGGAPFF